MYHQICLLTDTRAEDEAGRLRRPQREHLPLPQHLRALCQPRRRVRTARRAGIEGGGGEGALREDGGAGAGQSRPEGRAQCGRGVS